MKPLKIILSGGGTGGHIYPAVAIADELKRRHPTAEFLFVGAKDRMEMQKIPEAGYKVVGLPIAGLQRRLTLKNIWVPFKLIKSLWESKRILRTFQPTVAIGTGGYASAPLLRTATRMGIPSLIQEQNAYPGKTNMWLAKGASKICVAYPHMEKYFPKDKIVWTGNPIRQALLEVDSKREQALEKFQLEHDRVTVLVLGGSLGARAINAIMAKSIAFFQAQNTQVIWQCGQLYYEQYKAYDQRKHVQVVPFLKEMDQAYAAADVIISRAGALAVSELCVVGKPAVFIPSPNVAEDHQTKNALALTQQRAALMIKESELEEQFESKIQALLKDEVERDLLGRMIKGLAKPKATSAIVDAVEELIQLKETKAG